MRCVVGSRELKTRLGKYLRVVRDGATVVVTERGAPVAELRPIAHTKGELSAGLDRLEAAGLLTRGRGGHLPDVVPLRVRGRPVSVTLLEGRAYRL